MTALGGEHRDLGVSVRRDLSGSGRLARGGSARFSSLHFRSEGLATPGTGAEDAADEAPPGAAQAEEPGRAPADAAAPARPGLARRLLRWLGLG